MEWLEDHYERYKDIEVVKNDPALSTAAQNVLEGIHKKPEDLPTMPSKTDLEFLRKQYDNGNTFIISQQTIVVGVGYTHISLVVTYE